MLQLSVVIVGSPSEADTFMKRLRVKYPFKTVLTLDKECHMGIFEFWQSPDCDEVTDFILEILHHGGVAKAA